MNKVYDYRIEYRIEGERDFSDTCIFPCLMYLSEEDAKNEITIMHSFEQLVSWVKWGCIPNAIVKTFFGKVYAVELNNGIRAYSKVVFKKRFKPVEIQERYIKENELSIEKLRSYLKADDFIKYLKDRGITKL